MNPPSPKTETITSVAATVAVAALWAICHPYIGVVGDARLYLGRDLANLDPAGLGRDLAFAHDGQSRFSIFQLVTTPLVAALGVPRTGLLVALAAMLCTFAAALAFARSMARCLAAHHDCTIAALADRLVWPTLIVLAILPTGYGDPGVFSFFETSAIPRPFAEAATVAALAAALDARWWRVSLLLALALLLHPIMALVGITGLLLFVVAQYNGWRSHRRAIAVAAGSAAFVGMGIVTLAAAGREPFAVLVARIDPAWWALLIGRSPHLFPTLWTADAFTRPIAQTTTVLIAAALFGGTMRRVLAAVAFASLGQLALAVLLADTVHLRLATEIQLWRGLWLLSFVSACALVPCAAILWRRDAASRLVLLLLMLLWLVQASPIASLAVAGFALVLLNGSAGRAVLDRHVVLAAGCIGLLVVLWNMTVYIGYVEFVSEWSARLGIHALEIVANNLELLPVLAALIAWALLFRARRLRGAIVLAASVLLVPAAALTWDQRTPLMAASERVAAPPGFARLASGRPHEVLWLGGIAEPWFMLGWRQYFSPQQAVGIVFSRPLAMEWRRRADLLISLGLVHPDVFTPWKPLSDDDRIRPTATALERLCRRADAPGIIVVPQQDDVAAIERGGAITWSAPPHSWAAERRASPEWHRVTGWTALPCAAATSNNRSINTR